MTNSYKVKPQRQVRDQVALPAAPKELPRPAAPLEIPQQVGGQLIDRREYLPDPKINQALTALSTWSGVSTKLNKQLGEERLKKAQQDAEKLIQQETYALQQSLQNASEVEQLRAKKEFAAARYAQLKNPYINFFYYGQKATDASKIISTKLNKWGKDNADRLARIEDPSQRAALIQAESDELKKPYSNLPQNWVEARIDPTIAQSQSEIKGLIATAELDVAQEKINRTVREAVQGPLVLGNEFFTVDSVGPTGTRYHEGSFKLAYKAGFDQWVKLGQPGGIREYNKWFFENFGSIFADNNENNYNDLAEVGIDTVLNGLKGIDVGDGIQLLDTKFDDGKGNKLTMRERITNELLEQQQTKNKIDIAQQKNIAARKSKWRQDTTSRINNKIAEAISDDGVVDWKEIEDIRKTEREALIALAAKGDGWLPYSLNAALKELDKLLPVRADKISNELKGQYQIELDQLIAAGGPLPEAFLDKIRNTEFYYTAVKQWSKQQNAKGTSGEGGSVNAVVSAADKLLKDSFKQSKEITGATSAVGRDMKLDLAGQAYNKVSPSFKAEAADLARTLYQEYKATPGRENSSEKDLQDLVINDPRMQALLDRPEYSQIGYHFDTSKKVGENGWGEPLDAGRTPSPIKSKVISTDSKGRQQFDLTTDETDNGQAWRIRNRGSFQDNPGDGLKYAANTFLFNNDQFKEINTIPALKDPKLLSPNLSTLIQNRASALNITVPELLERQITLFNSGDVADLDKRLPTWRENLKLLERLRPPQASTGVEPGDEALYIFSDNNRLNNGDRGIVWEGRKVNQAQSRVSIPNAVPGKVIYAANDPNYGNTVVIEAQQDYPLYHIKKGDQIVVSHLSKLAVNVGDSVGAGQSIGMSGDRSDPNSTEGQSTTGYEVKPGQVVTTISKGDWRDPTNQYNQHKQKFFFRKAYTKLYSAK